MNHADRLAEDEYLPAEVQDDDRWFPLGRTDDAILYCLQICCDCGAPHRVEIDPGLRRIRFLGVPPEVEAKAREAHRRLLGDTP